MLIARVCRVPKSRSLLRRNAISRMASTELAGVHANVVKSTLTASASETTAEVTAQLKIAPADPYGDDTLNEFCREVFTSHSLETVNEVANYSAWAFDARVPVSDGSAETIRVGAIDGNIFWGSLNIHRFTIVKEWRRRGVGARLMTAALEHARSQGCVLACVKTFEFQAPEFYEKLGFKLDMVREGYANGHKLYYFSKKL